MNINVPTGRQPSRLPWLMDRLLRERAIALGNTIEPTMLRTYNSALTSYLTFICAHNLPTSPTKDTLSFYVVYMSHHISPRSVTTYLSGIAQQLEPFYPLIREICNSKLVQHTLQGCFKSCSQPAANTPYPSLTSQQFSHTSAASLHRMTISFSCPCS